LATPNAQLPTSKKATKTTTEIEAHEGIQELFVAFDLFAAFVVPELVIGS
jgi:hypothetical protein